MIDIITIMERVERLRDGMHISQSQFALSLGISRTAYQNLKQGKTQNFFKYLPAMAAELGTSEEYLILGYEPVKEDADALHAAEGFKERMKAMQEEYENALTGLRNRLDVMSQLAAAQEETIRVYKQLLSQYEKNVENA